MTVDILLHLYHTNMWDDFRQKMAESGLDYNLFVNIPQQENNLGIVLKKIKTLYPTVKIITTENTGRDIGGTLRLLDLWLHQETRSKYLILCHTKTDPTWRKELLNNTFGKHVLDLFQDEKIGMVGSSLWNIPCQNGLANYDLLNDYFDKYELENSFFSFIGGTIFCVKASIFEKFFAKFPPMDIVKNMKHSWDSDNSIPQAFERIFGILASQNHIIMGMADSGDVFDERFYLEEYKDVADAVKRGIFRNGYEHYYKYGIHEGRKPINEEFNERIYLDKNPDVFVEVIKGAFKNGYAHYLKHGRKEGRLRG